MDKFAPVTSTTGRPGWTTMASESALTKVNVMFSPMANPSLRATTGGTRATSTFGTRWVSKEEHRQVNMEENYNLHHLSSLLSPGQYYETCDGSSSSVTINTTNIPLGAEVMEVLVYRQRERRKYSPLTTDNSVYYITGKRVQPSKTSRTVVHSFLLKQIRSQWRSTSPKSLRLTSLRTCSSVARTWSSQFTFTTPATT